MIVLFSYYIGKFTNRKKYHYSTFSWGGVPSNYCQRWFQIRLNEHNQAWPFPEDYNCTFFFNWLYYKTPKNQIYDINIQIYICVTVYLSYQCVTNIRICIHNFQNQLVYTYLHPSFFVNTDIGHIDQERRKSAWVF